MPIDLTEARDGERSGIGGGLELSKGTGGIGVVDRCESCVDGLTGTDSVGGERGREGGNVGVASW